jgi:hypothetical protein
MFEQSDLSLENACRDAAIKNINVYNRISRQSISLISDRMSFAHLLKVIPVSSFPGRNSLRI